MHNRLGSSTVAAGFPQGKQPQFPMGEIPLRQYSWCIYHLAIKLYHGKRGKCHHHHHQNWEASKLLSAFEFQKRTLKFIPKLRLALYSYEPFCFYSVLYTLLSIFRWTSGWHGWSRQRKSLRMKKMNKGHQMSHSLTWTSLCSIGFNVMFYQQGYCSCMPALNRTNQKSNVKLGAEAVLWQKFPIESISLWTHCDNRHTQTNLLEMDFRVMLSKREIGFTFRCWS